MSSTTDDSILVDEDLHRNKDDVFLTVSYLSSLRRKLSHARSFVCRIQAATVLRRVVCEARHSSLFDRGISEPALSIIIIAFDSESGNFLPIEDRVGKKLLHKVYDFTHCYSYLQLRL